MILLVGYKEPMIILVGYKEQNDMILLLYLVFVTEKSAKIKHSHRINIEPYRK